MEKEKYIAHLDMDAFFASVEQRDRPEYMGKPVIIGADPRGGRGRGVVSTCSYEARKYGVHSAMPISEAYRKCPDAVFLGGDMDKYSRVSGEILCILENFTPDIEPVGIDEAFFDITGSYHLFGTPEDTCRKIKKAIKDKTGLSASIGLAPNMMTAKIASDINKPDGMTIITKDNLLKFLHPLPIRKLWGIGEKTEKALASLGIKTIGDVASAGRDKLARLLGMNGSHLWDLAGGIDPREIERDGYAARSISNEYTFGEDTKDEDLIKDVIMGLSEKVSRRLRQSGLKCRTVTLKIRFEGFKTFTRSVTLKYPTNFVGDLYGNALDGLGTFDIGKKAVRLVGVKSSNLADAKWQFDLFSGGREETAGKKENIHVAVDKIKDKFGEKAIGYRDTL